MKVAQHYSIRACASIWMSMPKARAAQPTPVSGGTVPPKASLKIGSQLYSDQREQLGCDGHGLSRVEGQAGVARGPKKVELCRSACGSTRRAHLEDVLETALGAAGLERGVHVLERELGLSGETVRELELRVPAACARSGPVEERDAPWPEMWTTSPTRTAWGRPCDSMS